MRLKGDEKGFSLLESLFHLLITVLFMHMIVLFLLFKDKVHHQLTDSNAVEWELFMMDLQKDLADVDSLQINPDRSLFTASVLSGSHTIEYSKAGTVIRRRKSEQGHVPLLTSVRSVFFTKQEKYLQVDATLADGTKKSRRIVIGLSQK